MSYYFIIERRNHCSRSIIITASNGTHRVVFRRNLCNSDRAIRITYNITVIVENTHRKKKTYGREFAQTYILL